MPRTRYSIPDFITGAKKVLATDGTLAVKKAAIAEHLRELDGRTLGHAPDGHFKFLHPWPGQIPPGKDVGDCHSVA